MFWLFDTGIKKTRIWQELPAGVNMKSEILIHVFGHLIIALRMQLCFIRTEKHKN